MFPQKLFSKHICRQRKRMIHAKEVTANEIFVVVKKCTVTGFEKTATIHRFKILASENEEIIVQWKNSYIELGLVRDQKTEVSPSLGFERVKTHNSLFFRIITNRTSIKRHNKAVSHNHKGNAQLKLIKIISSLHPLTPPLPQHFKLLRHCNPLHITIDTTHHIQILSHITYSMGLTSPSH